MFSWLIIRRPGMTWADLPTCCFRRCGKGLCPFITSIPLPGTASVSSSSIQFRKSSVFSAFGNAPRGPLRMVCHAIGVIPARISLSPLSNVSHHLAATRLELMRLPLLMRASIFMLKCDRCMKRRNKCAWLSMLLWRQSFEGALKMFSFTIK